MTRRVPLALVGTVGAAVLAIQAVQSLDLVRSDGEFFDASAADGAIALIAAAVAALIALVLVLPARRRWLPVAAAVGLLAVVLLATATAGGRGWAMLVALLLFASAWEIGERTLRHVGAPLLADAAPVAWLVGTGLLSLLVFLVGRAHLLRWWTVGLVVIVTGLIGAARVVARLWARHRDWRPQLTDTPLGASACAVLAVALVPIAVYAGAPEIQYDALYAKAWLPQIWAEDGRIGPLIVHPVLNNAGIFQVFATPGHLLGAEDVGRYLQFFGWPAIAATVWWWGARFGPVGPLAAVAFVMAPQLMWQATTAYDDLLLTFAGLSLAIGFYLATPARDNPAGLAWALGLAAGTCVWAKLHLAPLALLLLAGWILASGRERLVGCAVRATVGTLIVGAPAFVLRWIDTGNPVFPALNNIFKSRYAPPVNDTLNLPFWHDGSLWALIRFPWKSITEPTLMAEAMPPGGFGLVIAAVVMVVVIGWIGRSSGSWARITWLAICGSVVLWWIQFRYLRYLLPAGAVATALLLASGPARPLGRRAQLIASVCTGAIVVLFLPSFIAAMWNVPARKVPLYAAIGRWDATGYERTVFSEYDAVMAFEHMAPPGAMAASEAHQRLWLTEDRDLSPLWEMDRRLRTEGPPPQTGLDALRRMRALGVTWALVRGSSRFTWGSDYLAELLRDHGEVVFGDRGWELFRLVEARSRLREVAACDPALRGEPGCWTGLDRSPGAAGDELPTRMIRVCAGQTLLARVRPSSDGAVSQVTIDFDAPDPKSGYQFGEVIPGAWAEVGATAPAGAHTAAVALRPGSGSRIVRAEFQVAGPRCAVAP